MWEQKVWGVMALYRCRVKCRAKAPYNCRAGVMALYNYSVRPWPCNTVVWGHGPV